MTTNEISEAFLYTINYNVSKNVIFNQCLQFSKM